MIVLQTGDTSWCLQAVCFTHLYLTHVADIHCTALYEKHKDSPFRQWGRGVRGNTNAESHNKLPPLPPSYRSFDSFSGSFQIPHCALASRLSLTLCLTITIHLGPLAFCLTARSLHISLNILQYSNTAHIKKLRAPFHPSNQHKQPFARKKKNTHLPRCHFMLPALALTCSHLRRGIVHVLSRLASLERVWMCSLWRPGFSRTETGNSREARQFDTTYCMSHLIGTCFIRVHWSVGSRVN